MKDRTQALPPWRMKRTLDYMEGHYQEHVTVLQLAQAAGLSPSHFARSFALVTGVTPHRYLMRFRVAKATRLLEETTKNQVEIAINTGFSDQSHLIRAFLRLHGMTPAAYRRKQRALKAAA